MPSGRFENESEDEGGIVPPAFAWPTHLKGLKRSLAALPDAYSSLDTSRPTALYFSLSSLSLLNLLSETAKDREQIIDWLYSLQLTSANGTNQTGFRGSIQDAAKSKRVSAFESAHIAQTYSVLCCLLILGDDLKRVQRAEVLEGVRRAQCKNGSFSAFSPKDSESDMRFTYCAAAICHMLNDFSYIDLKAMCAFIRKSINYDGGIGQGPGLESHGGSTYCAVAALELSGHLWDESAITKPQLERLKRWLLMRQSEGFHGRINKPDDSCYAFWIGAALKILNSHTLANRTLLRRFLLTTQDLRIGGFSKFRGTHPDILHTYFSIASLSLFNEPDLQPMDPALNLPLSAVANMRRINRQHKQQ